jgi:hypothetical protein
MYDSCRAAVCIVSFKAQRTAPFRGFNVDRARTKNETLEDYACLRGFLRLFNKTQLTVSSKLAPSAL